MTDRTSTRPTPAQFANATWDEIAPLYETLAARDLAEGETPAIETWLDEWNALDEALNEATQIAEFEVSGDSTDPVKEEAERRLSGEIDPRRKEQIVRLADKLLATGYSRPDLETTLRRFRSDRDIFREENIPLEQEDSSLKSRYSKLTSAMSAEWRGETVPLPRLNRFMLDPDRTVREDAWRRQLHPFAEQRDEIEDIFDAMLATRQQVARNAGFANYRDYTFAALHRFDYTPAECESFHEAVATAVVPTIRDRRAKRQAQLGVDTLRPWDLGVDPLARPALIPYTTIEDLNDKAQSIFAQVDPLFGEQFGIMRRERTLDLDSRGGKRPGGFCNTFSYRKIPYIFMNAGGTSLDLFILLHEAGHAIHGFAASALPFVHQRFAGEEFEEVGSMSMELLGAEYLAEAKGGCYSDSDARRELSDLLESRTEGLAWIATVDAFQHWLYTSPDAADRDARDEKFVEIWRRFDPGVDWSNLDDARSARWLRQLHIFRYPFYYIEYGVAGLGALQVWRNFKRDPGQAIADYRAAMALGGSRPLPELYERAGARLIFDTAGMQDLATFVDDELARIEAAG
jgi:oligoendopeptidase F